jgi:membrane fusion protein, multidrug efflux system
LRCDFFHIGGLAAFFSKLKSIQIFMDDPKSPTPASESATSKSENSPAKPPWNPEDRRKVTGRIISIAAIAGAVLLILWVWGIIERHPRTDDAIAQANVINVAPRVRGQIIKLNVQDNQEVKEGDVLFEIDPADYELALENAKAALASLDQQIEVARSQDEELKFEVMAAAAGVEQAKAELKQASDTLHRMQPLLPKGFTTANDVDKAETAVQVATATLAAQEQRSNKAKAELSSLATLIAQRPGAVAAVNLATLNLSYCKVVSPFQGKVINLNISVGGYANVGVPVFSLLDMRHWYVIANFREGEIRHFAPGTSVDVYLLSAPNRHFAGKVQGIGWAVESKDYIDISQGVPAVPRELNWVHIAQRFPVRIEIENPDPELFRMGASAVAIIKSAPASQ